eukprot:scaffold5294_cov129-Cylindrotheca_fusiformis.AAC.5
MSDPTNRSDSWEDESIQTKLEMRLDEIERNGGHHHNNKMGSNKPEDEVLDATIYALGKRAYHLPMNKTWCQDWVSFMRNNHPFLGLCCSSKLSPITFGEKVVGFAISVLISITFTNFAMLWRTMGDEINDEVISLDFIEADGEPFEVTMLLIVLWGVFSAIHAIHDLLVWYFCCSRVSIGYLLWFFLWVGAAIIVSVLLADSNEQFDTIHVLVYAAIELAMSWIVWYPLIGTILFSGILGCFRFPIIGGRPRQVRVRRLALQRKRETTPMNSLQSLDGYDASTVARTLYREGFGRPTDNNHVIDVCHGFCGFGRRTKRNEIFAVWKTPPRSEHDVFLVYIQTQSVAAKTHDNRLFQQQQHHHQRNETESVMRLSFSFPLLLLLCLSSGATWVSGFSFPSASTRHISKPCSKIGVGTASNTFSGSTLIGDNIHTLSSSSSSLKKKKKTTSCLYSFNADNEEEDGGFFSGIEINPLYALPWVGFLAFATFATIAEAPGTSQTILDKFLMDPVTPPGVNEMFVAVFNLLGLAAIPIACITMPSAAKEGQKKVVVPLFLAKEPNGGPHILTTIGKLGIPMSTRKQVTDVSRDDLGWVTKNVLENKIFNWFIVALALSSLYSTGFIDGLVADAAGQIEGFTKLLSSTAIASASSCDLAILTFTAASLIPEDLKRRGVDDSGKSTAIAASTVLLPIVGATIYCALRPSLPEKK